MSDDWISEPDPDEHISCELTLFETYFAIARACHARAHHPHTATLAETDSRQRELPFRHSRLPPGIQGLPPASSDSDDTSSEAQSRRLVAVAVVFAALTLEAFINSYISERLGVAQAMDLDRRRTSIRKKWTDVTKSICNKDLPQEAVLAVNTLFAHRDALAHAKPKYVVYSASGPPPERDAIDEARGLDPIALAYCALNGLKSIDPLIHIDWASRRTRVESWNHFL